MNDSRLGKLIQATVLTSIIPLIGSGGVAAQETWADKLGYPAGSKVLILHADDIGMSWEANVATERYLTAGQIQSGSVMIPAPWAADFAAWVEANPGHDVGIHLTLNSEWETYRWKPVERPGRVRSLVGRRHFLLPGLLDTFVRSSASHVGREIEAQVRRARELGMRPTHLDTHIGTVLARSGFFRRYLDLSRDLGVPAMTMENVRASAECLAQGNIPLLELLARGLDDYFRRELRDYPFPSLDVMCAVPVGDSYEEVRQKFFDKVCSLEPGIIEFYFHPSDDTEGLRRITPRWQQRVWEGRLFADPEVIRFFEDEGILFTDWREMMRRFEERRPRR